MAKKDRVKMRCKICDKETTHELRNIDGQETYVCLLCEGGSGHNKKGQTDYKYVEHLADAERLRIWSNIPRGF